ncbi:MAG: hypothetical protein HYS07_01300 [Chlamydiae bacterium]|nr:hypothetical protein [Chlamydiota bacterium]MBI3276947.1 hypothetical protein [Chlamydiota bacterium]
MKTLSRTVRRSVALPRQLVEEVVRFAPHEFRRNLNRIVNIALQEFIAHQKRKALENAMAKMARDPEIRSQIREISKYFSSTENDGLKND